MNDRVKDRLTADRQIEYNRRYRAKTRRFEITLDAAKDADVIKAITDDPRTVSEIVADAIRKAAKMV